MAAPKYLTLALADGSGTVTVTLNEINQIYPSPLGSGSYVEVMPRVGLKKTYHVSDPIETISDAAGTGLLLVPMNTERQDPLYKGTAQSGGATTIVLEAGLELANDALNGLYVMIVDGTGAGQVRLITDYVGATDTCTVGAWAVEPDSTSVYFILQNHKIIQGIAQAGGATSIQLEALLGLANDALNGKYVIVFAGTGYGQIRLISDYVGATDTCTVSAAWDTNPAAGSVYLIVDTPYFVNPLRIALLDDTNMKVGIDLGNSAINVSNYNGTITQMIAYANAVQA